MKESFCGIYVWPVAAIVATIPGVEAVVAVGSVKSGVGKITLSVNHVLSLAQLGCKVGLPDANLYSPNVPLTLGPVRHQELGVTIASEA